MRTPQITTEMQLLGPGLWARRHLADLTLENGRISASQWLAEVEDWQQRIPRSCDCIRHWDEWVKTHPPDPSRPFEWGVDAHNEVNERIGKDAMSYDFARTCWST